jgi:DNA-binding NarL/FixJ family response regulator
MINIVEGHYMTALDSLNIILISNPGLRRDTLLALLKSISGVQKVFSTDTLDECERAIPRRAPALVIVDHSLNENLCEQAVPMIRGRNPKAWILMLVAHPRDTFAFSSARPDSILCDGFSSASLMEEILKAFPFHESSEQEIG